MESVLFSFHMQGIKLIHYLLKPMQVAIMVPINIYEKAWY